MREIVMESPRLAAVSPSKCLSRAPSTGVEPIVSLIYFIQQVNKYVTKKSRAFPLTKVCYNLKAMFQSLFIYWSGGKVHRQPRPDGNSQHSYLTFLSTVTRFNSCRVAITIVFVLLDLILEKHY